MSMPRLQLKDVKKRLGTRDFRFNLTIDEPGIVAVVGPSGAGKTTLFNLIAGFEVPEEGEVLIGGADVTGMFPGDRPLTMIFQDHNLFSHLDVYSNVGLGISPSLSLNVDQKLAISDALAKVELAGFEKRMPTSLSGGERQRVAFARALVRKRPLVLLDEPFAALDMDLRQSMNDLLVGLRLQTDALILVITHDRDEAKRIANRIVHIEQGQIVEKQLA